jgi:serine/threonine protein phosphatase PrpC
MMGGIHDTGWGATHEHPAGGGKVLGKKLRLAAAGMTDIGRRRERNQDNTTHYVPTDATVLAEKGALFVVCDGMGGHAAGEVAAELAVKTIKEAYYAGSPPDIITGITDAIGEANYTIFNYAREHPELAGMGTTCVALVVHGGRAYVVNIGDSRAYLVRDGSMRQVTLDHSWVAEQVRAGILSETQARTHAHRNVITRSLGTQMNVNGDIFIETLADGDRVLLCSDGLHGYVDEPVIERQMVEYTDPELGVRTLIDLANDNGGPDNITAVVIHLLEVPEVTDELALPPTIPGDMASTQPLPAITMPLPITPPEKRVSHPPAKAASRRAAAAGRTGGSKAALAVVRLLAVAAMVAIAIGIWDVDYGPYAASQATVTRLQRDVTGARQVIKQAGGEDPLQALTILKQAQQRLTSDLGTGQLGPQSAQDARNALNSDIPAAVQAALRRYNTQALITPIAPGNVHTYQVVCTPPSASNGQPVPLADVTALTTTSAPPAGAQTQPLYALSGGVLYRLNAPLDASSGATAGGGASACIPIALPGGASALALASDGTRLYALVRQPRVGLVVLAITSRPAPLVTVPLATNATPTLLMVKGKTAYVAFTLGDQGAQGAGVAGITPGAKSKPQVVTTTLPHAVVSLAFSGPHLYALLTDGSLGDVAVGHGYTGLTTPPTNLPIFDGAPESYTTTAPIPTVSPPAGTSTPTPPTSDHFANDAAIAADAVLPSTMLVGDPSNHRVVRLNVNAGSSSFSLAGQYVYARSFAEVKLLAVAANTTQLNVYLWSGTTLLAFTVPASGP